MKDTQLLIDKACECADDTNRDFINSVARYFKYNKRLSPKQEGALRKIVDSSDRYKKLVETEFSDTVHSSFKRLGLYDDYIND